MRPEVYQISLTDSDPAATQVSFTQNASGCVILNEGPGTAYVQIDGSDPWIGQGNGFTLPPYMGMSFGGSVGSVSANTSGEAALLTVASSEGEQGTRLFSFKEKGNEMLTVYDGKLAANPTAVWMPTAMATIQSTDARTKVVDFNQFYLYVMIWNDDQAVPVNVYLTIQGMTPDGTVVKNYVVKNDVVAADLNSDSMIVIEDAVRSNGLFIQASNRSASVVTLKVWLLKKR